MGRKICLLTTPEKQYFDEKDARPLGRDTRGVKGIELEDGQKVISLMVPSLDDEILTVSENGFGKNQKLVLEKREEQRSHCNATYRNGKLIFHVQVVEEDEVILITDKGTLVRTKVSNVLLEEILRRESNKIEGNEN